jgi:hypothetical protein
MSRPKQEEENDEVLQLDPKKRQAYVKVGGRARLADPFASNSGLDKDEMLELAAEKIQGLKKENEKLKRQVDPSASLIPRRCYGSVVDAKKALAEATGGKDGDYKNDFSLKEVPRLLLGNPRLLCYPPFANTFVDYLYFGNPATVRKTLLSLHKRALKRQSSAKRAMLIWEKCREIAGQVIPIAEVARAEKLSVSMVKKRLSEARHRLGRPLRRRNEEKRKINKTTARYSAKPPLF